MERWPAFSKFNFDANSTDAKAVWIFDSLQKSSDALLSGKRIVKGHTAHIRQGLGSHRANVKGKKLIPTKDGYNLVAILPDSLTSPQLTAEWETRLTGIAKGSDSPADFMRGIEEMTAGLVKTYSAISEDKAKLFTPQREAIGTCPRCGAAVYEGKKNFYCSDRASCRLSFYTPCAARRDRAASLSAFPLMPLPQLQT